MRSSSTPHIATRWLSFMKMAVSTTRSSSSTRRLDTTSATAGRIASTMLVMISSSGHALSKPDVMQALQEEIFPLCTLVTPNLHETAAFCGRSVQTRADMEQAAQEIAAKTGGGVLVKGGHLAGSADDLLYADGQMHWLPAPRIDNPNTHGTGCTLSSAIACNLAQGVSLLGSVKRAKRYLTACIQFGLDLGHGSGPLQHKVEWSE